LFILINTIEVEKIQTKETTKFKTAPRLFLPLAITINRIVAKAFSMIFNIKIIKYIIRHHLYIIVPKRE
jgi:hypothetical protein